jgi:hypothetical protein
VAELIQNIYSVRDNVLVLAFKLGIIGQQTTRPSVLLSIQLIETSRLEYLRPTSSARPIKMIETPNPGSAPLSLGGQDLLGGGHCTMGIPCIIAALRKAVREPYSSADVSTS